MQFGDKECDHIKSSKINKTIKRAHLHKRIRDIRTFKNNRKSKIKGIKKDHPR